MTTDCTDHPGSYELFSTTGSAAPQENPGPSKIQSSYSMVPTVPVWIIATEGTVSLSVPLCLPHALGYTLVPLPSRMTSSLLFTHQITPSLKTREVFVSWSNARGGFCFFTAVHVSTQSEDNSWYASRIQLQEIHLKLDLATIDWLVHIPGSPQGEPICRLLSPEDPALFLCDSLNAALLCTWASSLFLQKDGTERDSSGNRRQNFSRSL